MPNRPRSLELAMAGYLLKKRLIRREARFPFTLMLEPLELCNLACAGCGRIREYDHVFHKRLSVEECLRVADEAGAPIVNIPGGEPLIHKQIDEIVNGITAQGRFVYLCTNGLLMERAFGRIPPSDRFAFVVHIDGMEEVHDRAVAREGVFQKATAHMREAIARGYRVCTNTTIFRGVPAQEYVDLFTFLRDMGVEGCITSPGFDYESVTQDREQFLAAKEAEALYTQVHDLCRRPGRALLQQPALPRVPPGQAGVPLLGVVDADVHGRGLAHPLLPAGRRARLEPRRSCTRGRTGRPTGPAGTRGAPTARCTAGTRPPPSSRPCAARRTWSRSHAGEPDTLVLVCAVPAERRALRRLERPGVRLHLGGMGAAAAARAGAVVAAGRPRALLAVGFCGALDPALRVGRPGRGRARPRRGDRRGLPGRPVPARRRPGPPRGARERGAHRPDAGRARAPAGRRGRSGERGAAPGRRRPRESPSLLCAP